MTEDDADPFDQLAAEQIDEPIDFEALFAEGSIGDFDPDTIWEELESARMSPVDDHSGASDLSVLPKRSFCQRCPHLSDPTEVRCTHEGTEILEFVDTEHVRVRNCPVVAERERDTSAHQFGYKG